MLCSASPSPHMGRRAFYWICARHSAMNFTKLKRSESQSPERLGSRSEVGQNEELDRPRARSVTDLEAVPNPYRVMDQHVPIRGGETWISIVLETKLVVEIEIVW